MIWPFGKHEAMALTSPKEPAPPRLDCWLGTEGRPRHDWGPWCEHVVNNATDDKGKRTGSVMEQVRWCQRCYWAELKLTRVEPW